MFWTGSRYTAQTVSGPSATMASSIASAHASAKRLSSAVTSGGNGDRNRFVLATWTVPGTKGSNAVLIAGRPVIDERTHGRAVVGERAGDDLRAGGLADRSEVRTGEFPRRLDRFRPARGEEHAVEVGGRQGREPRRQLDGSRMGRGPDGVVGEPLRLRCGRLGELASAMADLDDEQAREPVEVALARVVEQMHAFAADEHRDVVVGEGAEPAEVQPEVAARQFAGALRDRQAPSPSCPHRSDVADSPIGRVPA